jgi:hypothetical protein
MKTNPRLSRILARGLLALLVLFAGTGCVASRYKPARKKTPPPRTLNVTFVPGPLEASLSALITYNGPGSWKRNAFWDEYVVALRNPGPEPLLVSDPALVDPAGTNRTPGSKPWVLERESKTLERHYKDTGIAFVRYTVPGVLILGTGMTIALANTTFITWGPTTAGAGAGGTVAAATLIALPVYYVAVLTINHRNKAAMEKEFTRRRLDLPLTLAPGESRTGSLFFPMVPNPQALKLRWSTGQTGGESILPLEFLHGLHTRPADATPH